MKGRKGETGKDIPSVGSSPKWHHSQGWARLKSGARNFILISLMGSRSPSTWTIFHCLPRELDQKQSSQDLNQHSDMG